MLATGAAQQTNRERFTTTSDSVQWRSVLYPSDSLIAHLQAGAVEVGRVVYNTDAVMQGETFFREWVR
ncbi:MAG: hypothetical protein OWT27_07165, partial [Firmicutes bacterium]|nr:hypothetical protein [Bacillota bacterium]